MSGSLSVVLAALAKAGAALLIFNEIRGLVLATPVLFGIYEAGGTFTAIYIGVCSLAGIALSVIVPMFAASRLQKLVRVRA